MEGTLPWIYLAFAGLMEIGWPVGLKMAQAEGQRVIGVIVALAFCWSAASCLAGAKGHPHRHTYAV